MTNERIQELANMTSEELEKEELTKQEKRYLQNGIDSSESLNRKIVKYSEEEKKESRKSLLELINKYSTK